MKQKLSKALLLIALCFLSSGLTAQIKNYSKNTDGVVFEMLSSKLYIQFFNDKVVRVCATPNFSVIPKQSIIIVKQDFRGASFDIKKKGSKYEIKTSQIIVTVDQNNGAVSFSDIHGKLLLNENQDGRNFIPSTIQEEQTFNLKQTFSLSKNEAIYGLGQYQDGIMNWRGHKVTLIQKNMTVAMPFLVSTNKYGILWDNYSHTEFESNANEMSLWSEVGEGIDYYFIYGVNTDEIISGMRFLTGKVPMLPKWAYGFWQSKERYKSRNEVMNIAAEYRRRKLPIDVIVQDWQYWGKYGWSSMLWDESTYPEPKTMLDSLHNVFNIKMMISIWPHLQMGSPVAGELNSKGYLFHREAWNKGRLYDAYNKEARDIYWKHINNGLMSVGIDGLWMDATEPEISQVDNQLSSKKEITSLGKNSFGTFSRYLNTYSLFTCMGAYENQRKETDKKRVMILTRSAFVGQQRTGAITWSGDIASSYAVLKNQISGGLNFSLTGNPYWNTDIGGFFPSGYNGEYPLGVNDSSYRELYVRWFQFGTFCPIMRSHGTGTPREIWQFGEEGGLFYDALVKFDNLRYRLLPYIYSMSWKITANDYTLMRALPMDFPDDAKTFDINDEYMFGSSFLVKPVTNEIYFPKQKIATKSHSVPVYLPASDGWYDFWTGNKSIAGTTIDREVPLDIMPLYVRAGSIIPLGPKLQYANEKQADTIEIRIYRGANGEFELYEDEGDGYNYEKGEFALIPFSWNNMTDMLTIGKRKGEYKGLLKERIFNIILVNTNKGVGLESSVKPDIICNYVGEKVMLKITD